MTATQQFRHTLPNGLTLLAERLPHVRSAAMTFLLPAGGSTDPLGKTGSANVLSDWILRGAGSRDSRELTGYLDSLGVQRGASADSVFFRFNASLLAKNLHAVLPVYADLVQRPHLPDDGFGPAIDLTLQQIDSIEDEPSHKMHYILREQFYDFPLGRSPVGVKSELQALTPEQLRDDFRTRFGPKDAILAVAGLFDWEQLTAAVEELFSEWKPQTPASLPTQKAPRGTRHVTQDTNQVQIGLAYDALPDAHPDSICHQTAIAVLSGGMGARLFTEIREKQGLCYSVHASYSSLKDSAAVFGYAGSAPDRAQKTLDSFLIELARIRQGITQDELDRAQTGMKSRIIMQGESSAARASALAYDFYHRGHTRTLADLRQLIASATLPRVNAFLADHPVENPTIVTLGPEPLQVHPA